MSGKPRSVDFEFDAEECRDVSGETFWEFRLPGHEHIIVYAATPEEFIAFLTDITERATPTARVEHVVASLTRVPREPEPGQESDA